MSDEKLNKYLTKQEKLLLNHLSYGPLPAYQSYRKELIKKYKL